jgi:hypothetical protein
VLSRDNDQRTAASGRSSGGVVEISMTTPPEPGTCPCLRPAGRDGFCEDHAGAVAFRIPVGSCGELRPAHWWHWAHSRPCPLGEGWLMVAAPSDKAFQWACPHRTHASECVEQGWNEPR